MKTKYHEIMDRIQVTEEMHDRVLEQVAKQTEESQQRTTRIGMIQWKRWGLALAVFVLAITGNYIYRYFEASNETGVLVTSSIEEMATISQLEEEVGFPIENLNMIPFEVNEVTYVLYGGDLAQSVYGGEEETLVFRKSAGEADNSGDYSVYTKETELIYEGKSVLLKGDDNGYVLAVWKGSGYSYSLSSSEQYSEDVWREILENME